MSLASDDELVLVWSSYALANLNDEIERARDLTDRALAINPNFSSAWTTRGWMILSLGEGQSAIEAFDKAVRLNPLDNSAIKFALRGKTAAAFMLGRRSDQAEFAKQTLARSPSDLVALFNLRENAEFAGQSAEAKAVADKIRSLHPQVKASHLRKLWYTRDQHFRVIVEEAITRFGFPE